MRLQRAATLAIAWFVLVGCTGDVASPPASSAESSIAPTISPPTTSSPAESLEPSSAESPEPIPSDELGAFSCDLPVVEDATVARANITDVRVGTHAGHDRVVFEFADGLPEFTLDRATPPSTHDASGMPIDVEGASFLRLTMRGGTKQTEDGTSSYDGPTDFAPAFPSLISLIEGGDFEAQSTWYLGLSGEACVRVLRLTDDGAPRIVIDVEH
ncbi:MAG: AMIN-like domain-containing (lipo)protein [Candidatus Limnocylindria bacterium]